LYSDGGNPTSAVNIPVDPGVFSGSPFITDYNVVLTSSDTGLLFRFQIYSNNFEGSSLSNIAAVIIAQEPDTPLSAPYVDLSQSDGSQLMIEIGEYTLAMNGGSPIISY